MRDIENHFLHQQFEVVREPDLRWGRADLGIYKDNEKPLLVEVGSVSLFKVWMNLEVMTDFVYLLVPSDEKLIEFTRSNHPPRFSTI
ncbi:hypothetical protein KKI17_02615 [Patescibacteria group bacterium]|nr:hypothetical protein [Patescibacteria group bacterium]